MPDIVVSSIQIWCYIIWLGNTLTWLVVVPSEYWLGNEITNWIPAQFSYHHLNTWQVIKKVLAIQKPDLKFGFQTTFECKSITIIYSGDLKSGPLEIWALEGGILNALPFEICTKNTGFQMVGTTDT